VNWYAYCENDPINRVIRQGETHLISTDNFRPPQEAAAKRRIRP
jgi:hypothetical protein